MDGQNFYHFINKHTPLGVALQLFKVAHDENLIFFRFSAVDFLEKLNVPLYKIASFEITDIPLIDYIAAKGKPIILSTGIATEQDILLALDTIRNRGNNEIVLLKCTSSYPAPPEESNLCMIRDFQERFNVVTGLSDHTLGINAPVVAVTQGAKIIEKHIILDKSIGGPDASFSLDENEFKTMVEAIRETEKLIGDIIIRLLKNAGRAGRFICC